jgi:hypothetical protein
MPSVDLVDPLIDLNALLAHYLVQMDTDERLTDRVVFRLRGMQKKGTAQRHRSAEAVKVVWCQGVVAAGTGRLTIPSVRRSGPDLPPDNHGSAGRKLIARKANVD